MSGDDFLFLGSSHLLRLDSGSVGKERGNGEGKEEGCPRSQTDKSKFDSGRRGPFLMVPRWFYNDEYTGGKK